MKLRSAYVVVAALAVVCSGVVACSSSSAGPAASSSSEGGGGGNASQPAKTGTITIGSICDCSFAGGGASPEQNFVPDVMNAWVKWTNAHGGVNGYQVKLVQKDTGYSPTTALSELKEMVERDHVVAIVGEESFLDASWAPYISKAGVPVIGGETADVNPMSTNPDFFPIGPNAAVIQGGVVAEMKKLGLSKYTLAYCAEVPVCAKVKQMTADAAQVLGYPVTTKGVSVALTQPKYTAQCLALKSSGGEVLGLDVGSDLVKTVVNQCATVGYRPTIITASSAFGPSLLKVANTEGSYWVGSVANYLDNSVPGVRVFHTALERYAPKVLTNSYLSGNALWSWLGGELFVKAANAAHLTPSSSGDDVKKGLYALPSGEDLDGAAPPLNFVEGRPTSPGGYFVSQLKNGQLIGSTPGALRDSQVATLTNKAK